jgi:hypothetical protein
MRGEGGERAIVLGTEKVNGVGERYRGDKGGYARLNEARGRYFWVHRRLLGRGGGIHGGIQEGMLGE